MIIQKWLTFHWSTPYSERQKAPYVGYIECRQRLSVASTRWMNRFKCHLEAVISWHRIRLITLVVPGTVTFRMPVAWDRPWRRGMSHAEIAVRWRPPFQKSRSRIALPVKDPLRIVNNNNCVSKNVTTLIVNNFHKLEPISIILTHCMLKLLASKCI